MGKRSSSIQPTMNDRHSSTTSNLDLLQRGTIDVLPDGGLAEKLRQVEQERRPLRVKLGIDPTAPDIHLGHTVVLNKLRQFQDAGHTVVLIVGDYTARVGDPSGRSATRPALSIDEIENNAKTFAEQAFTVLDRERVEIRYNSEWLQMSMDALFGLARTATVNQLLVREDFSKRYSAGKPISVLELLYPLLQGYDSVAVEADLELGGTDQKFNLLLGRDVQRAYGKPEQVVMTLPILPGTDGVQRMSKSLGNYIGVTEPPEQIYGKVLSVPDEAMETYFELLFSEDLPADLGPRDAKRLLARRLVARFHSEGSAKAAEQQFDRVHIERGVPDDIPEHRLPEGPSVHLPALIVECFGGSRSEARRMLEQGGVKIDGESQSTGQFDLDMEQLVGVVLQVGKRRFVRLVKE